jgi:hypothetical protein
MAINWVTRLFEWKLDLFVIERERGERLFKSQEPENDP